MPNRRQDLQPVAPHLFTPTAERPVRLKVRVLRHDERVRPHAHPWAQVAFSFNGVTRLTTPQGSFVVPPSRALWIPPAIEHAVTVVETATVHTLYLHQPPGQYGPDASNEDAIGAWRQCRVLAVSDLLRALVQELDPSADGAARPAVAGDRTREGLLVSLLLDELHRADPVPLGVDLPQDKRLRALCEAMLDDPTRHASLQGWARDAGASPRTIARLFQHELGTSFAQWRQQALLSRAVALAAQRKPMAEIAAELGYASPSAFSAMVRRCVGLPPRRFLALAEKP
ncbi:helix-turn-helix domain-containing protein [Aquabacterium sp. J223]|uniref:AraC family transcriptional regulator n=1 Tax=Aquabacterium sp. J223 TaxID=2898431 RepID=UPI0021ADF8D2|nr:helix-turn-helix transcriptional regulator [Aquabacterium sp. J223]UUX94832.1 helix-turn-helix transcriptional regulator [Aquabacterium sp. J223]